nr:response regulator transcription factor [Micromonospora provocatoris]
MATILLIDEDHRYRRLLGDQLTRFGHLVTEIALHESGRTLSDLTCHTHRRPDVVIVDPVVPAVDGLLLMRLLCVASRRPVLAHSIRSIDDDVVRMLRAGADGFLPKPCPPAVVDASVRALLRRVPPAPPPAPSEVGALRIDVAGRSVSVDGRPVALTRTEFELLAYLAEHPAGWCHGRSYGRGSARRACRRRRPSTSCCPVCGASWASARQARNTCTPLGGGESRCDRFRRGSRSRRHPGAMRRVDRRSFWAAPRRTSWRTAMRCGKGRGPAGRYQTKQHDEGRV